MTAQPGGRGRAHPPAPDRVSPPLGWAALALLVACGGSPGDHVRSALDAVVGLANEGYHTTVAACLAAEREALDRSTTADQWTGARDKIRPICDTAVAAWEGARSAEGAAEAAVAACERAGDAACFDGALTAITTAQKAIDQARAAWETARRQLETP